MSDGPWPYTETTREHICANLAGYRRRVEASGGLRTAAVSVVLAPSISEPFSTTFLLTLRAPRLNSHGGQYALPGGKIDPGEDALSAARRELHDGEIDHHDGEQRRDDQKQATNDVGEHGLVSGGARSGRLSPWAPACRRRSAPPWPDRTTRYPARRGRIAV